MAQQPTVAAKVHTVGVSNTKSNNMEIYESSIILQKKLKASYQNVRMTSI
jgi:hypothetical protein